MKFGVCTGLEDLEQLKSVKNAGFDYVESRFAFFATSTDEEFEQAKKNLAEADIKCESANCFIPGDFKIADSSCDREALAQYIEKGLRRGAELGVKTVVLGSGGARRVPEHLTFKEGFRNVSSITSEVISPIAEKYGINIAIEPLRYKECNIFNKVKEGVMLAASTGKDNIWGLADLFHMIESGDTFDDIRDVKGNLIHAHIARPKLRVFPKDINEFDYKGFVDALTYAGCERMSIEASCENFIEEIAVAGKVMEQLR